jgi:hypothetical protein
MVTTSFGVSDAGVTRTAAIAGEDEPADGKTGEGAEVGARYRDWRSACRGPAFGVTPVIDTCAVAAKARKSRPTKAMSLAPRPTRI